MTLNQVVQRLESLALSHKQINHFFFGDLVEWLANGDLKYPCCFVELNNAPISKADHQTKYNFSVWFLDLVNVDTATRMNEVEVMSDLMSIAEDYSAMLNYVGYQDDFTINTEYNVQPFREKFEDMTLAMKMDITVGVNYTANRCQVPATGLLFEPTPIDSPSILVQPGAIWNYTYTASGLESNSLTISSLVAADLLLVFKGDKRLSPTVSNPTTDEYTFNMITGEITFGTGFEAGQKIQFIYK